MSAPSGPAVRGLAERQLTIPLGQARATLIRAIGEAGFGLELDQLTVVQASRGSKVAGASGSPDKLPIRLTVRLTATDPGCLLSLELVDQWKLPVRRPVETYRTLTVQLMDTLDRALRRADPAAQEFPAVVLQGPAPSTPTSNGQAVARMTGAANRYLEGGTAPTQRRAGWQESGSLVVSTPRASAAFDVQAAYGMVTAGTLIVSRPAGMPAAMVEQVSTVVGVLEASLEKGGNGRAGVLVELDDSAIPVVEFLTQQARIREQVAVRTLQVCTTCRLAKVVNPDYTKLKAKRHRTNILSNSIGAVIGTGGISPFVLVGKLAQLNQLDLEFVCPRCQGLHAESSLITFCPQCGEQCDESALRRCRRCTFDFRSLGSTKELWEEPLPVAAVGPSPVPPAHWAAPDAGQRVTTAAPPESSPTLAVPTWSPPEAAARIVTPPNWYPDPGGRHQLRWWDGATWTDTAVDNGLVTVDPL